VLSNEILLRHAIRALAPTRPPLDTLLRLVDMAAEGKVEPSDFQLFAYGGVTEGLGVHDLGTFLTALGELGNQALVASIHM
jgi:hypothetical protein